MCVCVCVCGSLSPFVGRITRLDYCAFFRRLFVLPFTGPLVIGFITLIVYRRSYISLCAHIPTTQRGRFNIYFVPICTWEFILIYGTVSSASDSFILRCHLDDSVFAIRYFGTSLPALQKYPERDAFHQSGCGDTKGHCRFLPLG